MIKKKKNRNQASLNTKVNASVAPFFRSIVKVDATKRDFERNHEKYERKFNIANGKSM